MWKRQPDGGLIGLGTSPSRIIRRRLRSTAGSGIGTADSSAIVYGCSGRSYSASRVRDLDDLAQVHHRDPVGDVADHRQVVGDEEVRQAESLLELLEQVHDLRLDAHVERRDRLVAHDELRVQRERAGDADALALAARELVRVAAGHVRVEADDARAARSRAPAAPGALPMPWISSGSATIDPTVSREFRLAYGSWKTICMSRRSRRSSVVLAVVRSWPSKQTAPAVGL